MNSVTIRMEALQHNLSVINGWMRQHGASWTVVTKVLCGHADSLRALQRLGVRSMGDSRLENLRIIERVVSDFEAWYLRVPAPSSVDEVVAVTNVSLNSELEVIRQINESAGQQSRKHRVVIMIELGDLREGILPGSLIRFYKQVFELPHVEVIGIGTNLGCFSGSVPTVDQFMQLALYRELLELKFEHKLPLISGGSTAVLPLLLQGSLPRAINHFRIGEALFLGTDLINGGTLEGLRSDAVLLNAEIAEIKKKSLVPLGEVTSNAATFETESDGDITPGQRGYRAIVSLGELDTDIGGLTPVNPAHRIAGASSDVTVINLDDNPDGLGVGDVIQFRTGYSSLLRLMSSKYIEKRIDPLLDDATIYAQRAESEVAPAIAERQLASDQCTVRPRN
ncbi:MAG: alanine racemase [Phycisphaerae bacterium]|nr:alanine racemase [Phycisphaerae bacterium]